MKTYPFTSDPKEDVYPDDSNAYIIKSGPIINSSLVEFDLSVLSEIFPEGKTTSELRTIAFKVAESIVRCQTIKEDKTKIDLLLDFFDGKDTDNEVLIFCSKDRIKKITEELPTPDAVGKLDKIANGVDSTSIHVKGKVFYFLEKELLENLATMISKIERCKK